jgi:hypothetical protein
MGFIAAGSCSPLRAWSRLEPRARQVDFAEALGARIADPMFMLGRQWQFGEFRGEDGGSAVFATIARRVTPVSAVDTDDPDTGLEPVAERLPFEFPVAVRARLGRTVLSWLDTAAVSAGTVSPPYDPARYRALFRAELGIDDDDPADALGQARDRAAPRLHRVRTALRGRAVDGLRVLRVPSGRPRARPISRRPLRRASPRSISRSC